MTTLPSPSNLLCGLLAAVAAWWLLGLLAPVLVPFLAAAVMAYVLHPLVDRWQARRLPRSVGSLLAVLLLSLALLSLALLIVPVVTHQIPLLREQIPPMLGRLHAQLLPWLQRVGVDLQFDVDPVRQWLGRIWADNGEELVGGVLASLRLGGSAVLALFGYLVLLPVVTFYLLLDWPEVVRRCQSLIPPRWRSASLSFFEDTDAVLGQYLRGQLLVMLCLALFYAVALAVVGLDLALPIGVFTGVAVFVPYLGFGLGLVLGVLAALLQFQALGPVLGVCLVFMAGQLLESFYLTPRLLGERIGLHPLVVIFALMAFGQVFGFVGVLVALPASAVLLVALRRLQAFYMASALYADEADRPSVVPPAQEG